MWTLARQIGFECQVEGSCAKDVEGYIRRVQRILARERAEVKAKRELAEAEAIYPQKDHPSRPLWRGLLKLRRKLLEALESITQPGDEQRAREMCDQRLRAFRKSAEECVRAALEAGREPILKKAAFQTVCPRCNGSSVDPTSTRDDLGNIVTLVVCIQCKGTKVYRHGWYGKTIRFIGQPQVTERVRDDGLVTIVGEWNYEVTP